VLRIDCLWNFGRVARVIHPVATNFVNPACPWLPEIQEVQDFSVTRGHGQSKGAAYYLDTLRYAQSLWRTGKPAQAILQLNKAWMADLAAESEILETYPSPYGALVWILEKASSSDCGYLGNPVRHFQHLASRMSGPRPEIRAWRAWLCFCLAEKTLTRDAYPRDGGQIAREGLWIPSLGRALDEVSNKGWPGEPWLRSGAAEDRVLTILAQKPQ
jgi:hypothetical protein